MEVRNSRRFSIQLACRIRRGGIPEVIRGTTLDISYVGALIQMESDGDTALVPAPGEIVKLEVLLPANRIFGQRCLACEAVALRVTQREGVPALAVRFRQVEIRSTEEAVGRMASTAVM